MDTFLEKFNLTKLSQEIINLNNSFLPIENQEENKNKN